MLISAIYLPYKSLRYLAVDFGELLGKLGASDKSLRIIKRHQEVRSIASATGRVENLTSPRERRRSGVQDRSDAQSQKPGFPTRVERQVHPPAGPSDTSRLFSTRYTEPGTAPPHVIGFENRLRQSIREALDYRHTNPKLDPRT